jgi:hypothetical protein
VNPLRLLAAGAALVLALAGAAQAAPFRYEPPRPPVVKPQVPWKTTSFYSPNWKNFDFKTRFEMPRWETFDYTPRVKPTDIRPLYVTPRYLTLGTPLSCQDVPYQSRCLREF